MLLQWSLIFFVVAVVAAIFGFSGVARASSNIARILFFIFAVLFVISLVMSIL